jgi:exosortase
MPQERQTPVIETQVIPLHHEASTADSSLRLGSWLPWIMLMVALWAQVFYCASYNWLHGEYYDYGWYVPPLALWFFYRKWSDWKIVGAPPATGWFFAGGLVLLALVLAGLRTMGHADPAWTLPQWGQAGIACMVTGFIVWKRAGKTALPGLTGVLLFTLTAVRLPTKIETALVDGLTHGVLEASSWLFNLFGRPIMVLGNQLEWMGEVVEVTEGCSGIRSIQSFLMVSLFLGEWMSLKFRPRVAMIGIGLITAWVTNVARATFLAWIRFGEGQGAFERFHDTAGGAAYVIGAGVMIWVSARMDSDRKNGRVVRQIVASPSV